MSSSPEPSKSARLRVASPAPWVLAIAAIIASAIGIGRPARFLFAHQRAIGERRGLGEGENPVGVAAAQRVEIAGQATRALRGSDLFDAKRDLADDDRR